MDVLVCTAFRVCVCECLMIEDDIDHLVHVHSEYIVYPYDGRRHIY